MQREFENVIGGLVREHIFASPVRLSDVPSWQGHIPFAYFLVSLLEPRTLVELGTHKGDSYSAFCQTVQKLGMETRCFAVDTWQGDDHAGPYSNEIYNDLSQFNSENFSRFSTLIRARFEDAVSRFEDKSIDLLHIDGLHTYEAVLSDFETWRPKLSSRSVVLFHDTQVQEGDFGVWKLWEELSAKYPAKEFTHSHGLGVLGYGDALDDNIRNFLTKNAQDWAKVQLFFERLGLACSATGTTLRLEGDLGRAQKEYDHLLEVVRDQTASANREQDHLKSVISDVQAMLETEQRNAQVERENAQRFKILADELREDFKTLSDGLREDIEAIRQSTSWKVTRPLRALARVLRRGRSS